MGHAESLEAWKQRERDRDNGCEQISEQGQKRTCSSLNFVAQESSSAYSAILLARVLVERRAGRFRIANRGSSQQRLWGRKNAQEKNGARPRLLRARCHAQDREGRMSFLVGSGRDRTRVPCWDEVFGMVVAALPQVVGAGGSRVWGSYAESLV